MDILDLAKVLSESSRQLREHQVDQGSQRFISGSSFMGV